MAGGASLTEHLVHWHRSCIKSFTYPYSEDQSFSTLTVATQYNDSSRSAVRMHQVCPFPAAQVQPAADGAWPWSVQLSKVMAHRFMFEHVGRIPSGTAVKNNKVMASGGWRRLTELPVSVPIFLNPQGRKETSLVSSRCVQHTPAMSCAIQATAALPQVGNSLWKCFIGSEIVASAAVGVAEESVISDRERPLSSKELLILPFLVVQYFLSFPSPVKYTLYSSGCQASAWQLCAACLATRKEALERELSAATAPICSTQALCSTAPHPSLLSPSINGSGSWEPWLIHHSAPYFPSGHRQENNIFFLPFHLFRARCIGSFFFCCPWVRVFLTNLLWATAGLLGVFRAELHSSNASNSSRQAPKSVEHHHLLVEVADAWSLGCHHSWPWKLCPFPEQAHAHLILSSAPNRQQCSPQSAGRNTRARRSLCHFSLAAPPQLLPFS